MSNYGGGGALVVDDLIQGLGEWRNIQDIVRVTFRALNDVVKSQATRSRAQNRKHAREILAQRLDDLQNGEQSRAGIVGAVRKKRADSAAKKSRRKYKKLEEEKTAAAEEQGEQARQADTASRDSTGEAGERSSQTEAMKTSAEEKDNPSQTSSDTAPSTSIRSTTGS